MHLEHTVVGMPERKRKEKGGIFEEKVVKNFLNLKENI